MRDKHDPVSECWEDAGLWMSNYREAHPEDERDDIDIYLDDRVYNATSPYWPLRDVSGTLIDWQVRPRPDTWDAPGPPGAGARATAHRSTA